MHLPKKIDNDEIVSGNWGILLHTAYGKENAMEYLLRSILFVPANNEKFIVKAGNCEADALIFDMEDAVLVQEEAKARILLDRYLGMDMFAGKQLFIRVNRLGTDSLPADMELLKHSNVKGIVLPKIKSADDVCQFDSLLKEQEIKNGYPAGKLKMLPLIETAAAVMNVKEIAGCNGRIIALLFGGEDFLDSVGGEHLELPQAFDVPRSMVVMAARMNGILPIDTPYPDLKNQEGFIAEERKARASGFAGVLVVTPNQIPWAHTCFSPAKEEIEYAEAVINAVNEAKNAGRSVAKLNGKMIGPPMQKRAEKVLALQELICNKEVSTNN